jgi:hypothetical protein
MPIIDDSGRSYTPLLPVSCRVCQFHELNGTLQRYLNVLDKQLVVQRLSKNAHRTGADRAQFLSSTWVSRDEKDRRCIAPPV